MRLQMFVSKILAHWRLWYFKTAKIFRTDFKHDLYCCTWWWIQMSTWNPFENTVGVGHTDLGGPILSKNTPLPQNWLQFNRKCLKLIVWHFSSPFLSSFYDVDTFSCFFLSILWPKTKQPSKLLANFCWFLANFVNNYSWLSNRHPLATTDVRQLNFPAI